MSFSIEDSSDSPESFLDQVVQEKIRTIQERIQNLKETGSPNEVAELKKVLKTLQYLKELPDLYREHLRPKVARAKKKSTLPLGAIPQGRKYGEKTKTTSASKSPLPGMPGVGSTATPPAAKPTSSAPAAGGMLGFLQGVKNGTSAEPEPVIEETPAQAVQIEPVAQPTPPAAPTSPSAAGGMSAFLQGVQKNTEASKSTADNSTPETAKPAASGSGGGRMLSMLAKVQDGANAKELMTEPVAPPKPKTKKEIAKEETHVELKSELSGLIEELD